MAASSSPANTPHAWLWESEEGARVSDLEMRLELKKTDVDDNIDDTMVMRLHRVVLASVSPTYFRPLVTRWADTGGQPSASNAEPASPPPKKTRVSLSGSGTSGLPLDGLQAEGGSGGAQDLGGRMVVRETAETPERRAAARAVLEWAYTQAVPQAVRKDVPVLLEMGMQADYWGMEACVRQCVDCVTQAWKDLVAGQSLAVAAPPPSAPSPIAVRCRAPPAVRDYFADEEGNKDDYTPTFDRDVPTGDPNALHVLSQVCDAIPRLPCGALRDGLFAQATAYVMDALPSARDILDPASEKHRVFLKLPRSLLAHWIAQSTLFVDSEDSVVALLDAWLNEPQGRLCSKDDRKALFAALQPNLISKSFAVQVMPLVVNAAGLTFDDLPKLLPISRVVGAVPTKATKRTRRMRPVMEVILPKDAGAVLAAANRYCSPPWWWSGLRWSLQAALRSPDGSQPACDDEPLVQVALALQAQGPATGRWGPTVTYVDVAMRLRAHHTLDKCFRTGNSDYKGRKACLPAPIPRSEVASLFDDGKWVLRLKSVM